MNIRMSKTLCIVVDKLSFDRISAGEQTEYYCDHNSQWQKRLIKDGYWHSQACKQYDLILLRSGFWDNAKEIKLNCNGVSLRDTFEGNLLWMDESVGNGGRLFVIKLGEILSV